MFRRKSRRVQQRISDSRAINSGKTSFLDAALVDSNVIPHDAPYLHPLRKEGTDFSEFADYTALGTDMAPRFPLETTTSGGSFDDTILFNGRRTLKVVQGDDYVQFKKAVTPLPRTFYRTIFRLSPACAANVVEMLVGGMGNTIISYQPEQANWQSYPFGISVSQSVEAVRAAGWTSLVALYDLRSPAR